MAMNAERIMKTTSHTPTPWALNDRMQAEMQENAAEIIDARTETEFNEGVRAFLCATGLDSAVNAHDALVKAAQRAADWFAGGDCGDWTEEKVLDELNAALRLTRP